MNSTSIEFQFADHAHAINTSWVLISSAMKFLMQAGFSLVEAGSVRVKNNSNILIKNLCDASVGAIMWYLLGEGFAYGKDAGGFIGTSKFAGTNLGDEADGYYLQWVF